jgi:DNA-binding CsgD family transcriptional regulator
MLHILDKSSYWQIGASNQYTSKDLSPVRNTSTSSTQSLGVEDRGKLTNSLLAEAVESLGNLSEAIQKAKTVTDIKDVFDRLCALARIKYLSITRYADGKIYSTERLRFTNFPDGWHQYAESNGHVQNGTLARKLADSMTPLAWSEVYADQDTHNKVRSRASAFGIDMNGFSIALRSARGACTTFFCNFNCCSLDFPHLMRDFVPQLVVLGQVIAERLDDILAPNIKHSPKLSLRELECLKAAAEGSMIKQTADKLHIAPQTVGFHLNMARVRLKAHNTTHAVAIAIAKKLISLD